MDLHADCIPDRAWQSPHTGMPNADTSNQLNTEMTASGDDDQYMHVTYDQKLRPPSLDFLTSLSSIAPGDGTPDFLDAITVAADSLFRTLTDRPELSKANVAKRLILISDFATPAKDDPEDAFVPTLMEKLAEKDVVLEVNCLDAAPQAGLAPTPPDRALLHTCWSISAVMLQKQT